MRTLVKIFLVSQDNEEVHFSRENKKLKNKVLRNEESHFLSPVASREKKKLTMMIGYSDQFPFITWLWQGIILDP